MQGVIVTVNSDRGFGFIRPDDHSEDVFFHARALRGDFTNAWLENIRYKRVDYSIEMNPDTGKLRAKEVHPAGGLQ